MAVEGKKTTHKVLGLRSFVCDCFFFGLSNDTTVSNTNSRYISIIHSYISIIHQVCNF